LHIEAFLEDLYSLKEAWFLFEFLLDWGIEVVVHVTILVFFFLPRLLRSLALCRF
jgi:hypothetical protein